MSETTAPTILVVANRTSSTPALLAEVQRRAATCAGIGVMVPPEADKEGEDWSLDDALRLIARAAGMPVTAVPNGPDAAVAVHDLVAGGEYDEIILATVPAHHARWHHHDLPHRIQQLGIPVTVIPPELDDWRPVDGFPPEWAPHAVNPAAIAGFGNY
jgi:hypothetical protein